MAPEPVTEWSAEKLCAVLTSCCYEHLANSTRHTYSSSDGTDSAYELEDGESDDDPLILRRLSDGRRFQVEFDATVWEVPADDN